MEAGYTYDELEIISRDEIDDESLQCYDIVEDEIDVGLGDRIISFFTGEDPEDRAFERFNWDDSTKKQACDVIKNDYYMLHVNREGYYDNPDILSHRITYIDEDIRDRDDLSNEQKIKMHEERIRMIKDQI